MEHFIDLEHAKEISKNFYKSDGKKSSNFINKKIEEHLVVNPDGKNPTSYIMNYEGGGFIIVSADDRTIPILAYSEKNKFPFNRNDTLPANLLNWLESIHILQ
ncbi:Spi family protease inhibitor [Autumnicola musiva]|uniref:Spi family protease inhibitor n=1 Tax=Autumnicola musiva TaxID=3075589 RepID=A0ABU3D6Z0_9FLAO|nr:Spi family protease inhibitor [Zunongwangia sp. F117]MDT0677295.1 Spi family protease inhibitor [Zunongwangia sp. F117]